MSSRRDFLKSAAVAVPAAGVVSTVLPGARAMVPGVRRIDPAIAPTGEALEADAGEVPTPDCTSPKLKDLGMVQAKVDARLLTKADRFFGGTAEGRVTELLQNSRRAGAKTVWIDADNQGNITYRDSGHGIKDFGQLLAFGFSGWNEDIEAAEDPAGAGFFSLAPREVTVASRGKEIVIDRSVWLGMATKVLPSAWKGKGVLLKFKDPDFAGHVQEESQYGPLTVYLNGERLQKKNFLDPEKKIYDLPELGCRVQLRSKTYVSRGRSYTSQTIENVINFHGQACSSNLLTSGAQKYGYGSAAIELTGAPTELRLVLPARNAVVKNEAAEKLKRAITKIIFGEAVNGHSLSYKWYEMGREMGFDLPESNEKWDSKTGEWSDRNDWAGWQFNTGGIPLLLGEDLRDDVDGCNLDILSTVYYPFKYRPATPASGYEQYEWAKKAKTAVKVQIGTQGEPFETYLNGESLAVVDAIQMKLWIDDKDSEPELYSLPYAKRGNTVLITRRALTKIGESRFLVLLGGYNEDRSSDDQEREFNEELAQLILDLKGPLEGPRVAVVDAAVKLGEKAAGAGKEWSSMTILPNGTVIVNGTTDLLAEIEPSKVDLEQAGDAEFEYDEEQI